MPGHYKPLSEQKGNLTVVQQNKIKAAEEIATVGNDKFSEPPPWLVSPAAVDEYKRLSAELMKMTVIGNLDTNNLAAYCNAFSLYREATEKLRDAPLMVEKTYQNGQRGMVENPLINIQRKYADEMRKFSHLCGLSIESRLKAANIKMAATENKIQDKYGDI